MAKKSALPFSYERFRKEFPEIEKEYDHLAKKCHAFGPLNEKMRRMIKLGIAIGSESEERSSLTPEERWPSGSPGKRFGMPSSWD